MPVTLVADALTQRAIDGCVVPWEVVPAIKVQELVKFHTDFAASPTFYTATFILAMNKRKYDSLPADLKKIIDQNSGQACGAHGRQDVGRAGRCCRGHGRASAATASRRSKAQKPLDGGRPRSRSSMPWLKSSKSINGEKLLADAKALLAKYQNT